LSRLRSSIEARAPVGFDHHDSPLNPQHDGLRDGALTNTGKKLATRYNELKIMDVIGKYDQKRVFKQLGTLGGGNHFIEVPAHNRALMMHAVLIALRSLGVLLRPA
jgi:tRNA-splicing ligase RtcB